MARINAQGILDRSRTGLELEVDESSAIKFSKNQKDQDASSIN